MGITYEEFMKLVPEDTKKYSKILLKYLNYYITENNSLRRITARDDYFQHYYSNVNASQIYDAKLLTSTFMALSFDEKYSFAVCSSGFDRAEVYISAAISELSQAQEKKVFDACKDLFCFHIDYTKYSSLLPIDIVNNALKIPLNFVKDNLFEFFNIDIKVKTSIKQLSIDEHTRIDMKKEVTIYENLPYYTVDYIETASRIRSILIEKLSKAEIRESEFLKKDDAYLVPISLLLAIFEYDNTDKNSIENFFILNNISLNGIYAKIGETLTGHIKGAKRNLESIELVYKRYWTDGINKDKATKEVKIIDILSNLFDRNFTKSIALEKMLGNFKKSIEDFANLNDQVVILENSKSKMEIKDFYSKISKDTKEFIIFACKSYQVLLKKIKLGNYNKELLTSDNDIVVLAMYLASHFYKTDIDTFYNYYGVTFEKIMKLLNIQITREEIEQEVLDKAILLDKFRKFVLSGINNGKNSDSIAINDVSLNLCSRTFNNSMFMENIFEEIRRDINLPDNFYNMLKEMIEKIKKEIIRKEKEEYFKDLPIEDLEYLTIVCQVYNGLIKTNAKDKYPDDLLVVLSLLLGLSGLNYNKTKDMFESIGISFELIYSHFPKISKTRAGDIDIELLKTKFNKYIYGGRNKGNNSPNIQDIALNIFNDELYKSLDLVSYLNKCGLSYEMFKNPEKLVLTYEKKCQEEKLKKAQEQKNEDAKTKLGLYSWETISLINKATYVYNHLIDTYKKEKEKYKKITSTEDIEILSIVLAILSSDLPQKQIFIKHGLNSENILEFLGLPVDYHNKKATADADNTLANVFSKYVRDYEKIISFLKDNEFYKKIIDKFVENVTVFETEVRTGKNYEESLSVLERINLIKEAPVEQLNLECISDVLQFGSSLELHSAYIQDKYPELMKSTEVATATEEIKKLVDSVYVETEVSEEQKGLFQWLLGNGTKTRKEVKINIDVINSLKPNIEIQIQRLYTETRNLSELKVYMEEYYKKNKEYIAVLAAKLEELQNQLSQSKDEDIFKINDLSSYITVLSDRLNTLKLTDFLLRQEYVKLNQVIVNHCITINSLLMSRNVLLPLIGTEMVIGNGINAEKEGLDVTKNILTLLNDLISQDVVGTKEVLEKLKYTNMSEEQLLLLTSSTTELLNQITKSKALQSETDLGSQHLELSPTNQSATTPLNNNAEAHKLVKKMY